MAPLTGTLEADVVTTIELGPRVYEVTVATDHDDIWFTTDGSDPYDGSPAAHHVLNYARSMTVPVGGGNETKLLKLWSATTPTYTVTVGAPADTSFTSLDHAGTDHTDIPGVGGGEGGVSIPESDTPPEDPEVGDLWLDTGTDAEQSGASVVLLEDAAVYVEYDGTPVPCAGDASVIFGTDGVPFGGAVGSPTAQLAAHSDGAGGFDYLEVLVSGLYEMLPQVYSADPATGVKVAIIDGDSATVLDGLWTPGGTAGEVHRLIGLAAGLRLRLSVTNPPGDAISITGAYLIATPILRLA